MKYTCLKIILEHTLGELPVKHILKQLKMSERDIEQLQEIAMQVYFKAIEVFSQTKDIFIKSVKEFDRVRSLELPLGIKVSIYPSIGVEDIQEGVKFLDTLYPYRFHRGCLANIYRNLSKEKRLKKFGSLIIKLAMQVMRSEEAEIKSKYPSFEKLTKNINKHIHRIKISSKYRRKPGIT